MGSWLHRHASGLMIAASACSGGAATQDKKRTSGQET
jgi:hypothetical protein